MEGRDLTFRLSPPAATAARVPAPPLQDQEALQEVQEAPQEALALPIGSFSPAAPSPLAVATYLAPPLIVVVVLAVRAPSLRRRSTTRRRRGRSPSLPLSARPAASRVSQEL